MLLRLTLFSSTSAFLGDIGEAGGGPSELDARATALQAFEILDHGCGGLQPLFRAERPSRPTLPPATYYLGGVNSGQRAVYDSHCSERYAARSPFHYSSRDEVQGRASLASDICPADRHSNPRAAPALGSAGRLTPRSPRALSGASRAVYEVSDAFVAFDGLVIQDQPDNQPARLFAFERMPGFNGLGRLLLALEQLQLVRLSPDGRQAFLRPVDLTLRRLSARHEELVGELPLTRPYL